MRIAIASAVLLLAGCGSGPTPEEEALNETAGHPEQLAHPGPGDPQFGNNSSAAAVAQGNADRAGITGATQGPTQGYSDAPAMGDQGSATGGDTAR